WHICPSSCSRCCAARSPEPRWWSRTASWSPVRPAPTGSGAPTVLRKASRCSLPPKHRQRHPMPPIPAHD
ncbi:MAG: hypothetical protein AVDCRST_MAG83-151, partial [uncultured Arthrobacter sp.]